MSNIDFEIGDGNPAAVAVRFHVAQHSFLSHMDFRIGSGLAGIYMVGNEAEDLHFHGGRYGVLTEKTSPAWQFTLLDSTFDGQREAAIREHEAQLTLAHDTFRNVPTAIDIDQGYPDELWVTECRFEHIAHAADRYQRRTESAHRNRIRERRVPAMCRRSRVSAKSGRTVAAPGSIYRVSEFNFGLIVPAEGQMGTMGEIFGKPSRCS